MTTLNHPIASWRLRMVIKVLLLVAQLLAEDETHKKDVYHLACAIGTGL
jgi:hypothetical protein